MMIKTFVILSLLAYVKGQFDTGQCFTSPCQGGGSAVVTEYICTCPAGYTGANCEQNVDECVPNPCLNGGQCIDYVNSFACDCLPGYTGQICEADIDECLPNPCLNGGNCVDYVNYYTCICAAGFTGANCETSVGWCDPNPCLNGGNCINSPTTYTCECIYGFEGDNCEIAPDIASCEYPVPISNVAVGKTATQSSTNVRKFDGFPEKAVDGNTDTHLVRGKSCSHTKREKNPYWMLDLGDTYDIYEVQIFNRADCCLGRIKTGIVRVGGDEDYRNNPQCGNQIGGKRARLDSPIKIRCGCPFPMTGRYVSVQLRDVVKPLNLCEVKVMTG